jgi:hypothetical protein
MKRTPAATYNVITALFGLLSVLSCACIGGLLVLRPSGLGRQVLIAPTNIVAPTDTLTFTPSATFTPSLTYTPTNTPTSLPTNTQIPSNTPVPTDTPAPTDIPTVAPTPRNTPAIVATAAATAAANKGTPVPNLLFAPASDVVTFSPNPDPTTGCNIMAIAGQILDVNGKPITSKVSVFIAGPNGFKKLAYPSTVNVPPYGVGFWLLVIKAKANSNAYVVEVLDSKTNQISSPMTVQFTADCQNNIAIINFQQTAPGPIP